MKNFFTVIAVLIITVTLFSCRNKEVTNVDETGLPDTIIKISRLIEEDPTDAALYNIRAKLFLDYSMPDKALSDVDKAIQLDPDMPDYLITKADIFFARGKATESIEWLKKARAVAPKDFLSLTKLGEIFLYIADYKSSLLYLDTAARLDDTRPEPWLIGGFSMLYATDTMNAIRYFNECLKRDKNNYKANLQLAVIYTLKLNPLALEYYQNALNINPESAEVYYNMGVYYQDMEKTNEAIDAYIRVTRLKDDMGFGDNAFYNLGYIHIELQVWDAARDYFGQAILANPAYYQAYFFKGYAHERLGDLLNAKSYYDKAIEMKPDYEDAKEAMQRVIGLLRTPM